MTSIPDFLPDEKTARWLVCVKEFTAGKLSFKEIATVEAIGFEQAILRGAELHPFETRDKEIIAFPAELGRGTKVSMTYIASIE